MPRARVCAGPTDAPSRVAGWDTSRMIRRRGWAHRRLPPVGSPDRSCGDANGIVPKCGVDAVRRAASDSLAKRAYVFSSDPTTDGVADIEAVRSRGRSRLTKNGAMAAAGGDPLAVPSEHLSSPVIRGIDDGKDLLMLRHDIRKLLPGRIEVARRLDSTEDLDLARRVIEYWRSVNVRAEETSGVSHELWRVIIDRFHRELIDVLRAGDPEQVLAFLKIVASSNAAAGVGALTDMIVDADGGKVGIEIVTAYDKLLCLAELWSALGFYNPELQHVDGNAGLSIEAVLRRIDERLGMPLAAPPAPGGAIGLRTNRGVFTSRDLIYAYAYRRLATLKSSYSCPLIVEVGGGLGVGAHFAKLFGLSPLVLFDLPNMSVVQAYVSARVCGMGRVAMAVDGPRFLKMAAMPFDVLVTTNSATLSGLPMGSLVLNIDSFPEIGSQAACVYLETLRSRRAIILSINHEAGASMPPGPRRLAPISELVRDVGGFSTMYRAPFWLRAGYVEELFVPEGLA